MTSAGRVTLVVACFAVALTLLGCEHAKQEEQSDGEAAKKTIVLVVDPAWDDSAGYVNHMPWLRKFRIVKVMTHLGKVWSFLPGHLTPYKVFTYQFQTPDPLAASKEICPQLKKLDIAFEAVIPTSDPAVPLTDLVAQCVGIRGNPASGPLAHARRNKWVMGETVRKAGLRTMREQVVSSWREAESFIEENWSPPLSKENPCVIKILQGSGGEGVVQATSIPQAKELFEGLLGSTSSTGDVSTELLVQEFLPGDEFAVDSVSVNGVNKIVAVWIEDFRPANGIFDQYFGFKLQDPEDPKTKAVISYALKILDATGLRNGAANTEIKWLEKEGAPCLVEINARWAGINWGDGLTVEDTCVGKNIIEAAFESYLDEAAFDSMPAVRPITCRAATILTLNYQAGILKGIPGLEVVKKMATYLDSDIDSADGLKGMLGQVLPLTTPNSIPVNIALSSPDNQKQVDADYDRIIQMEKDNTFFDTQPAMLSGTLATSKTERRLPLSLAFATLFLVTVTGLIAYASRRDADSARDYITLE